MRQMKWRKIRIIIHINIYQHYFKSIELQFIFHLHFNGQCINVCNMDILFSSLIFILFGIVAVAENRINVYLISWTELWLLFAWLSFDFDRIDGFSLDMSVCEVWYSISAYFIYEPIDFHYQIPKIKQLNGCFVLTKVQVTFNLFIITTTNKKGFFYSLQTQKSYKMQMLKADSKWF